MRRRVRRTERRWTSEVGLVGPNDVRTLQTKIHDYRAQLQAAVDGLAGQGKPLPIDGSRFSVQAWGDLAGRCTQYEEESESDFNPLAYLYAGSAYERGRALISELDTWRDELDRRQAPNLPPPIPVPHSDLGLAGGLGIGLLAILAIVALKSR